MSDDAVENNSEGVGNNSHTRCDYTASFPAEPFVEDRAAMVRNAALEEAIDTIEKLMTEGRRGLASAVDAIRALKT